MAERSVDGYCIECPVAQLMSEVMNEYLDDPLTDHFDKNSTEILSFPDNLTDEELDDAAIAFSMTDREAFQSGISEINLNNLRTTVRETLAQLGSYALESHCPQPRPIGNGLLGCQAVGSAIAYERFLMALETYTLEVQD